MAKKSVEIQKGPLKPHEETYRTMTRQEKVAEALEQERMRRGYQSQMLHEPKK